MKKVNTPYFVIKKSELDKNIYDFKSALKKYWPNSDIAYSIKTNSLPWILKYMNSQGILAEAVSDEEYELAELCGFEGSNIVFNGPIKSERLLKKSIKKKSIINIDSEHEVNLIKNNKSLIQGNLGVRINVETEGFDINDVGYITEGFRFGFSEVNNKLEEVVSLLQEKGQFGLHLHCNSITRSINVYRVIAQWALYIIEKYKIKPSYIDIGGGFFGGVENKPTAEEYIQAITEELSKVINPIETKLIIEPGSALIGSVIDFHTSVIENKETKYGHIVTTDGSRINIDPLWQKNKYIYSLDTKRDKQILIDKQIICGYTCMDHDRIMMLNNEQFLNVGDKIIYHKVGAYTVTFGGPFIRYFPEVYVEKNNELQLIRSRITVNDYFKIQSL